MMSVKNVYPFITVANLNCRTLLLGIPFLLLLFQVLLTLRERTQAINLPIHLVDLPVLLPIRLPPLIMMCLLKYFKTPTSYSQFRRRFRFVLQSLCYPDSIGYQVFILHRRFRRPIPPVSFLRLNICTHRVYHEVSLRPRVFRIRATHPYRWLLACHPVYRLHLFLLRMHHLSPLHHHHTTPYPPLPANLNAHAKHPNPLPFLPSFPVPTLNSTTGEIPLITANDATRFKEFYLSNQISVFRVSFKMQWYRGTSMLETQFSSCPPTPHIQRSISENG